jgi:hypothetical protein
MTVLLTDLIFRKKNLLTREECDFLIEEHNVLRKDIQLEHCAEATTGADTWSTFQRVVLKPGTPARDIMFRATEQMVNEYMDYLDSFGMFHTMLRGSMIYSHMYRLLRYDPGEKIHPHTDHDPFIYGSCTINLNNDYTGGDFVFWKGQHRVRLEPGEAMIWPADYFWVHEVEPVTTGVRYSTNSFLMSVPEPIKLMTSNFINQESNSQQWQDFDTTERYTIRGRR